MNLRIVLAGLALLLSTSCMTSQSRMFALVGQRDYDKDDWDPVEEQTSVEIGILADTSGSNFGFEGGVSYSTEDDRIAGMDVDADFVEVFLGGRYIVGDDPTTAFHPYVGVGGSAIRAELDGAGSDDDTSFGVYVRAGIGVDLDIGSSLGIDYRVLTATDIDLFGENGDADFDQLAIYLTFSF